MMRSLLLLFQCWVGLQLSAFGLAAVTLAKHAGDANCSGPKVGLVWDEHAISLSPQLSNQPDTCVKFAGPGMLSACLAPL